MNKGDPKNINSEPIDLMLENIDMPDEILRNLDVSKLDDFDPEDFILELVENTEEQCPLLRDALKETHDPKLRKVFDNYSVDQRKDILNDEYLSAIIGLSHLPVTDGKVEIPVNLVPQNWNGNCYEGTGCINLQMRMAAHPDWVPVFTSSSQNRALKFDKLLTATPSSILHKVTADSKSFRHLAWNVSELSFINKFPRHFAAMQTLFKTIDTVGPTRAALMLQAADERHRPVEDIVKDMVRATDAPGKRPRFNESGIPDRERQILKELTNDLATMSICSRLRVPSHVNISNILALNSRSFKTKYPFYEVMKYAGKITLDLNNAKKICPTRAFNMDTVTNRVNKEMAQELENRNMKGLSR